MKNKLRLTSLFLALLLLASFWGCSMPGIGDESGEATSEKATTTLPPEDIILEETTWDAVEETDVPADTTEYIGISTEPVPETTPDPGVTDCPFHPTANFGGEPVRILYGSDAERNEFDPEESGVIIDDYIFLRNVSVEDRLNVKLEWKGVASNASHAAEYVQYAGNMHAAGEPYYIYAATRRAMGQMLVSNLLLDINKIDTSYIDLEQPWYPATLREDLTVGGATFYITGDISANALLQMNAIFYNKAVAQRFERPNFEDLVLEGRWTLDALIELSQGLYIDEDGSGFKSGNDAYGFTQASYLDTDAFYSGSGLKFFETDPTGDRYVMASAEITSSKADTLASMLYYFFNAPSSYVGSPTTLDYDYTLPFAEERALFCHGTLSMTDNGVFTEEYNGQTQMILNFAYGILPIPKYNTEQEEYITTLSNKAVFWGINRLLDPDTESMVSAVIESMAYKGYSEISHAVFENVMKQRYSLAAESQAIFDLLRASIRVDIGKLFSEESAALPSTFAKCVTSSAVQWKLTVLPATFRAQMTRAEKELESIFEYVLSDKN